MAESNASYHMRRAASERRLAETSADPSIARTHRALADMHDERARAEERSAPSQPSLVPEAAEES